MEPNELKIVKNNMDIERLNTAKMHSKVHMVKDIPWYLEIYKSKKEPPKLIINVMCNDDDRSELWHCKAQFIFKIFNSDEDRSYVFEGNRKMTAKDFSICISYPWGKICDENEGFSVNGKLKIEVIIRVKEVYGVVGKFINHDFSVGGFGTDVILVVEGRDIHVGKMFLATYSSYFKSMFYDKESKENRIKLPEESYEHFIDLLNMIYPHYKRVTYDNYEHILKLAHFYGVPVVKEKVETFLINNRQVTNTLRLLKTADQYSLDRLTSHSLLKFTKLSQFKKLKSSPQFQELSYKMHSAILGRTLDLIDDDDEI